MNKILNIAFVAFLVGVSFSLAWKLQKNNYQFHIKEIDCTKRVNEAVSKEKRMNDLFTPKKKKTASTFPPIGPSIIDANGRIITSRSFDSEYEEREFELDLELNQVKEIVPSSKKKSRKKIYEEPRIKRFGEN